MAIPLEFALEDRQPPGEDGRPGSGCEKRLLRRGKGRRGRGDVSPASSPSRWHFPVLPQWQTERKSLGRWILCPHWVWACPVCRGPRPAVPVSRGSDLHRGVREALFALIHQHGLLRPRVPDQDLRVQRQETTWDRTPGLPLPPPPAPAQALQVQPLPLPFCPCAIRTLSNALYFYQRPPSCCLHTACIQNSCWEQSVHNCRKNR